MSSLYHYIYKRFTLLKIFLWCRGPKQLFYALISTKWNVKFVFKNKNFACDCLNYAKIQNIKEKKKNLFSIETLDNHFCMNKYRPSKKTRREITCIIFFNKSKQLIARVHLKRKNCKQIKKINPYYSLYIHNTYIMPKQYW